MFMLLTLSSFLEWRILDDKEMDTMATTMQLVISLIGGAAFGSSTAPRENTADNAL